MEIVGKKAVIVGGASGMARAFNLRRLQALHMSPNKLEDDERGVHHQHVVDRRLRGADRPGRLHGGQGRDRGDDPDDGLVPRNRLRYPKW